MPVIRRPARPAEPRTGSMCTGYGGLDAGVMAVLGGTLAWTADNDPAASAVITHRMPGTPNLGDIRQVTWENVPPVDILCAGFPCQPVSAAGKQKGMADERWLWPGIADAISRMAARPRLLVLENVPRLLTIDGGAAVSQIIGTLSQLGYVGCYGIYSAAEAGAAHLRKRWFCVAADAQGVGRPSWRPSADRNRPDTGHQQAVPHADVHRLERLQELNGESVAGLDISQCGHPDGRAGETVPYPDRSMRQRRPDQQIREQEERKASERDRSEAFPHAERLRPQGPRPAAGADQGRAPQATLRRGPAHSGNRPLPDPGSPRLERHLVTRCRDDPVRHRETPDSPAGRPPLSTAGLDWQEYEPAVRRWELISGYPVPYPVEPGKNGNHRMTAEFPEWLMGLPPGWVTAVPGLSRSASIRVIGNGVVPHQAALAVTSLLGRLPDEARG